MSDDTYQWREVVEEIIASSWDWRETTRKCFCTTLKRWKNETSNFEISILISCFVKFWYWYHASWNIDIMFCVLLILISCFKKYWYWYHALWNIDLILKSCFFAKWYICKCANIFVRILSSFIWLTKLLWVSRSRMWQFTVMIGLDRMYSGEYLQWGKCIRNTWY